jgi:RimJ/RimL family protein N-acetyltransferase
MPGTFDSSEDYILEDERVLLRPLLASDMEFFLPYAITEPDTWRFSVTSPAGEEGMKAYIEQALSARGAGKEYPFIIFDKEAGACAGCTRFYDIQPQYQTLQLGYTWYGKKFRGTGLNKHCKFLLLRFAFEELGMERVEFRADANNALSIAAMKSIGCTEEGILRGHLPMPNGSRRNSIILSILKSEWDASVKENLKGKL